MLDTLVFSGLGSVWVFSDLDFVGFSVTWIFVWFFQWFGSGWFFWMLVALGFSGRWLH